jgi:outer membrane murein-binding lipoprotein Lpp
VNDQTTAIISISGLVMSFLGPILLVLIQTYRDRKKAQAEHKKIGAETLKEEASAADMVSSTALKLIEPLRADLEQKSNEIAKIRDDAARVEFDLRRQLQESRQHLTDYMIAAEKKDELVTKQENEMLTRIADLEAQVERYKKELDRERSKAQSREKELLARIEALESDNKNLREQIERGAKD